MTSLERRARHRAELHSAIIDAALRIISEEGLGALSIRAIAERIEYSAAAIYLHFESKEALLHEVAQEGFHRMHAAVRSAVAALGETPPRAEVLRTVARAYLEFALAHTAFFRVMFAGSDPGPDVANGDQLLRHLTATTPCPPACAEGLDIPIAALATVHGMVSLHLSGRLADVATTPAELLALIEESLAPYAAR